MSKNRPDGSGFSRHPNSGDDERFAVAATIPFVHGLGAPHPGVRRMPLALPRVVPARSFASHPPSGPRAFPAAHAANAPNRAVASHMSDRVRRARAGGPPSAMFVLLLHTNTGPPRWGAE
jgi:hypothetical protein